MPKITHGLTKGKGPKRVPKLYSVWVRMKQRCCDKNHHAYRRYGGRGIAVCDEWTNNVVVFIHWAQKNGYREGLLLDRINNDGGYSPGNCRFVTYQQSNNNRSINLLIEAFGECKTLSEWAEDRRSVVTASTLRKRIQLSNWSPEIAITTKSRVRSNTTRQ